MHFIRKKKKAALLIYMGKSLPVLRIVLLCYLGQ